MNQFRKEQNDNTFTVSVEEDGTVNISAYNHFTHQIERIVLSNSDRQDLVRVLMGDESFIKSIKDHASGNK